MAETVDQWRGKETLLQQWIKWNRDFEPAELQDLERSVSVFERSGRPDLAWLTWRHAVIVRRLPRWEIRQRQRRWLESLIGATEAVRVTAAIDRNPQAGTATWPIPLEGASEAWSGDAGIHPLLAIKIERQLATIDVILAITGNDLRVAIQQRLKRVEILLDIGALEAGRREVERLRALGPEVRGDARLEPALADALSYAEYRVLRAERRFQEAARVIERTHDPRYPAEYLRTKAELAYGAGEYGRARETYLQFLAVAKEEHGYWAIMADLAAQRQGGREITALKEVLRTLPNESWVATGVRYLLGEISADDLMARASESGKMFDSVQQECEGAFWVAQVALAAGRTEEGIDWLRRCVATGFTTYVEFGLAKAELQRLIPNESAPPKQPEGRSALGVAPA